MFDLESETVEMYAHIYNGIPIMKQGEFAERTRTVLHLAQMLKNKGECQVKMCACGKKHNISAWFSLRIVGHYSFDTMGSELRNCTCGSTLTLITRRGQIQLPKSKIVMNSYMYRPVQHTRSALTIKQCVAINHAFRDMKVLHDLSMWEDRQLKEAAYESKPPEWKVREDGTLTPIY